MLEVSKLMAPRGGGGSRLVTASKVRWLLKARQLPAQINRFATSRERFEAWKDTWVLFDNVNIFYHYPMLHPWRCGLTLLCIPLFGIWYEP